MRVILQRTTRSSVLIDGNEKRSCQGGLLILLGIEHADTEEDIDWLCPKML